MSGPSSRIVKGKVTHIGRRYLDTSNIFFYNFWVVAHGFYKKCLHLVSSKQSTQRKRHTSMFCFANSLARERRPAAMGFTASYIAIWPFSSLKKCAISSRHFFTIFCRKSTDDAEAINEVNPNVPLLLDRQRRRTVDKEIIIGHILPRTDGSTSIVT